MLVIRVMVLVLLSSLMYLMGFTSGFNRGYSIAQCEGLDYSKKQVCWEAIK